MKNGDDEMSQPALPGMCPQNIWNHINGCTCTPAGAGASGGENSFSTLSAMPPIPPGTCAFPPILTNPEDIVLFWESVHIPDEYCRWAQAVRGENLKEARGASAQLWEQIMRQRIELEKEDGTSAFDEVDGDFKTWSEQRIDRSMAGLVKHHDWYGDRPLRPADLPVVVRACGMYESAKGQGAQVRDAVLRHRVATSNGEETVGALLSGTSTLAMTEAIMDDARVQAHQAARLREIVAAEVEAKVSGIEERVAASTREIKESVRAHAHRTQDITAAATGTAKGLAQSRKRGAL